MTAKRQASTQRIAAALLLCGLLGLGAAQAEPSRALLRKLAAPASARWSEAPLAPSLRRMAEAFDVPLWIDRRIDPQTPLTLAVSGVRLADVLDRVARNHDLAAVAVDRLVYLGPSDRAGRLDKLLKEGRQARDPKLKRRGATEWSRLATPRDLVQDLAASVGLRLANPEAVPHDLWPEGSTEPLPVSDRLTLLLFGFDLRWRIDPSRPEQLMIEPIDFATASPDATTLASRLGDKRPPTGPTRQLYTLRLLGQPLGPVLEQLSQQLGRRVRFAKGVSAERRVHVEVEQASFEELLAAIGAAAGVTIDDTGDELLVTPK